MRRTCGRRAGRQRRAALRAEPAAQLLAAFEAELGARRHLRAALRAGKRACGRGGTRSLRLRLGRGLRLAGDGLRVLLGVAVAVALAVRAAERAHEAAELAHESLRLIVAAALVGAVLFATAHGEEPHRVVLSIRWVAAPQDTGCDRAPPLLPPTPGKNQGAPLRLPQARPQAPTLNATGYLSMTAGHANSPMLTSFFVLRAIWRFEASLDTDPRKWFLRFRRSRDSCSIAAGQHVP